MLFTIDHTTEYRFTRSVFFEPHLLRFCPRSDGSQRALRYDLQIDPTPAGCTQSLDVDGNLVTVAWFNDLHDHLVLRARAEVETLRENPYDFLVMQSKRSAAGRLSTARSRATCPCAAACCGADSRRPSARVGRQLRGASRGEVIPFLSRLTETICHRFKRVEREQGSPWPAATTIEQRQGACRDLAVLWIDICRAVGLAARFVSGYYEGDPTREKHHLHAWGEAYLPGAGWRGFDPTNGLAVGDRHIAVAASADRCTPRQ